MQTALSRPGWKETMESVEHFLLERAQLRRKKDN